MNPTAGLGFKPEYFEDALACSRAGQWYEIHAENYMVAGGPRLAMLEALRGAFPISVHGVGLSLAADREPDAAHLARLCQVARRAEPFLISEHLAWSTFDGGSVPDLLPFPRTRAALVRIADNIDIVQSALRRRILIENPSLYVQLPGHELGECDFLIELVRRTGCGLLVDVNNVYVSSRNLGFDAREYLAALPSAAVGEIHLAGHTVDARAGLLIDTHDAPVTGHVWQLYAELIERIGPRPTLIERDDNLPAFDELMAERERAHAALLSGRVAHDFAELAVNG
ncbi:MAG TPA: DUF692 domain-containing protein [Steroidobacteraceae bacterium]|nr:DUF692 domain-containing protein [Steroidobacteraceae bacterium]